MKQRPYRCPGCDREAYVFVTRTTMHSFGTNGLVYSISCSETGKPRSDEGGMPNSCLGSWFSVRPFETETSAISDWNNSIIDMAAAALGITPKQALAIKEGRAALEREKQ